MANILDELERVMRDGARGSTTPQNDRISAFVSDAHSDLAVFSELDSQIAWHQPGIGLLHIPDEVEDRFEERTQLINKVSTAFETIRLADVGTPLMKFDYPSCKRRTVAMTQQIRNAEDALDSFWRFVNDHGRNTVGMTLHELLKGVLTSRELKRTPEWIEPCNTTTLQPLISTNSIVDNFSTLDLEQRTQHTLDLVEVVPIKTKIKTRGATGEQNPADLVEEDEPPTITVGTTATIGVSHRALKVFSILFNPAEGELTR